MDAVPITSAEGRRLLRRILRRKSVSDVLGPSQAHFSVTDLEGKLLFGSEQGPAAPAVPVEYNGQILGYASGVEAKSVAVVLSMLVEQAVESRAIAADSLQRYKELTMLYALSDRLLTLAEVEEIGTFVCEEAHELAAADGIAVLILNEETGLLEVVATSGHAFGDKTSIPVENDLIGTVLSTGRGEIVNDLASSDKRIAAENDFTSTVCAPLKARKRVFGVVVLGSRSRHDYTAADLQLTSALASQAAAAIEVARLNKVLDAHAGKPAEIIFGLNDIPPAPTTGVLGLQHSLIALMSIATPIIITLEAGGGSRAEAAGVISMSLVAIAIVTFLQSYLRPPFGAGYPLIPITSVIFLTPSLIAAESGGLGLVFGMTVFAGACMILFAQIISRFRKMVPPEISGVVVLMVGLSMIRFALPPFVGIEEGDDVVTGPELIVSFTTLAVIIVLTVSSVTRLRLFSTIIGIAVGTVLYAVIVGFDGEAVQRVLAMPILGLPQRPAVSLQFDVLLILPFAAAAMAAAVKDAGLVTSLQKANDRDWKRPETRSIGAAITADGVGSMISGATGGVGLNISAGSVGLAIASGALALMPAPVIGAGLIYIACFLIGSGIQLVQSRMLDARRTFTIGLALIGGIGVDVIEFDLTDSPAWLELILGNSLAFATVLAVSLNIILRVGVSSSARLALPLRGAIRERILHFMERYGALWGARSDVVRRAAPAVTEWCEELRAMTPCERVNVDMRFDEFSLTILIAPTSVRVPGESAEAGSAPLRAVAAHIQSRYQAKVSILEDEDVPSARLDFAH